MIKKSLNDHDYDYARTSELISDLKLMSYNAKQFNEHGAK
jgi:hypothetical protein